MGLKTRLIWGDLGFSGNNSNYKLKRNTKKAEENV